MKRVINKIIVLFLVLIATFALYFTMSFEKADNETITMGKATLPTVSMKVNNEYINMLKGYTMEMEPQYMRDSITPAGEDRKVDFTINNCNNLITGVTFEVRSADAANLYERTEAKDWQSGKDTTDVSITVDNMIEPDKEYILVLIISTDRYEKIYYYTRFEQVSEAHYDSMEEFAKYFSNTTFDKAKAEELIKYIEPSYSEENTNLGNVSIYSNFDQLTWGNLSPEKLNGAEVTYKELLGDIGSFQLDYKVKAKNDYDTEQYYNVTEYFRLKWTDTNIYLLDYRRTMNQIFDATGQSVTSSRVNLGIGEDFGVEYDGDKDGNYIAFVKEQSLWMMDVKTNQITSIFAFSNTPQDDDIRNVNKEHDIKIVDVSEKGDVKFLVYGYMNRGEHEGKVGVTLYQYNKTTNEVDETIFIPFTRSYQILKETMGKLMYVNDSDVMFIMLNDCIYSIDLTGNEYVQIISDVKDGCYAINDDSTVIAWEKDMSGSGTSEIEVMNLKTNDEMSIKAESGKKIKVVGFVEDDFAYGIADESGIVTDKNGITTVPMSVLRIVDMKGKEQKTYSQDGYYFTSAEVSNNMINLKRAVYAPDGSGLQTAPDYQIFGNVEDDEELASVKVINTDLKKKELVINFASKVITSDKLSIRYPKVIKFDDTNALSLRELISSDERYYVYGRGGISAICDNPAAAVIAADSVGGVVLDDAGNYVWARKSREQSVNLGNVSSTACAGGNIASSVNAILQANGIITDVSERIQNGESSISILNDSLKNATALELLGCTLDEVLYYVNKGEPVMGMVENENCVLIVGYDMYNAVLMEPSTGTIYKQGLEETQAQFKQYGSRFVAIN